MSILGTALLTRTGSSHHKARIIWDRLAAYVRAMASILRSSALVSLPTTSSAKSSAALAVKEFRWRCQYPPSRSTRGGKANPVDRSGRCPVRWCLLQARRSVRNRYGWEGAGEVGGRPLG